MKLKAIHKFYMGLVLFVLGMLINTFVFYSNYARYVNYHESLGEPLFTIEKYKIYAPTTKWKMAMEVTPNAVKKAKNNFDIGIFISMSSFLLLLSPKASTTYGSAKSAEKKDLLKNSKSTLDINLLGKEGTILGDYGSQLIRDNEKTHTFVGAPTRMGKGISVIIPTLLEWLHSCIVLDIKGENYQKTSGWRKKMGNKILRFSPKNENSCSYNPLAEIRYKTDREIEDTRVIANVIMQEETSTSDPFWQNTGVDFLTGVILHVMYEKRGKGTLTDVVEFITDPSKPLEERMVEVLEFKHADVEVLRELYPMDLDIILRGDGTHPMVAKTMADTLNKGEKTMQSIIAGVKTKLSVFEMPSVKRNTSKSDFRISDLMNYETPVSLYIVVEPGDIASLSSLIRILIIQTINLLTPEMDFSDGEDNKGFKHRLLFLLDEFPALGRMEVLEKALAFIAGYGMKAMLIVQSLAQLNKAYGNDNSILDNCQIQLFYTANDNKTAEYVSKSLGKETIKRTNVSTADGKFGKKTYSEIEVGRDLMTLDEVRKLCLTKIIIFCAGKPPILANKIFYFKDKRFKNKIIKPVKSDILRA